MYLLQKFMLLPKNPRLLRGTGFATFTANGVSGGVFLLSLISALLLFFEGPLLGASNPDCLDALKVAAKKQSKEASREAVLSPEQQAAFQEEMTALLRLIRPQWDFAANPVHFVLKADPRPNGYYTRKKDGTHEIGTTTGLIEKSSKDLLAFILAHEAKHLLTRLEFGEMSNSILEEILSDLAPLRWLEDAGLDARVGQELFVDWDRKSDRLDFVVEAAAAMVDPHPANKTRISLQEGRLANLSRERNLNFRKGIEVSPLPKRLLDIARDAKAPPVATAKKDLALNKPEVWFPEAAAKLRAVLATGDKKTIQKTLLAVEDGVTRIASMLEKGSLHKSLKSDVGDLVDAVLESYEILRPIIFRFRRAVVMDKRDPSMIVQEIPGNVTGLYEKISLALSNRLSRQEVVGKRLNETKKAMEAFSRASTFDEALSSAQKALELLEKDKHFLRDFSETIGVYLDWAPFKIESSPPKLKEGKFPETPVPWNHLVEFARKDSSRTIAKLLGKLGVADPRIYELLPPLFILKLGGGEIVAESTSVRHYKNAPESTIFVFDIDENGHIQKALPVNVEMWRPSQHYVATIAASGKRLFRYGEFLFRKAAEGDEKAKRFLTREGNLFGHGGAKGMIGSKYAHKAPELFFAVHLNLFGDWTKGDTAGNPGALIRLLDAQEKRARDFPDERPLIRTFFLDHLAVHLHKKTKRDFEAFVFGDYYKIFSLPDKVLFASRGGFRPDIQAADGENIGSHRKLFGFEGDATSAQELKRRVDTLDALKPDLKGLEIVSYVERMKAAELYRFLKTGGGDPALDTWVTRLDPRAVYDLEALRIALGPLLENYRGWPTEPHQILSYVNRLSQGRAFSEASRVAEKQMEEGSKGLQTDPDPFRRIQIVEELFNREGAQWPTVRNRLEDIWTKAVGEVTEGNETKVLEHVDRVVPKLYYQQKERLFHKLADRLTSGRSLSDSLSERLNRITKDTFEQSRKVGGPAEALKALSDRDSDFRLALMDLLYESPTQKVADNLERAFMSAFRRHGDVPISDIAQLTQETKLRPLVEISPEERRRYFELLYASFWAATLPEKAAIARELLFPQISDKKLKRAVYDFNREWVINILFPPNEPYAKEAGLLLRTFTDLMDDFEQPYFVAAALTAAEKGKSVSGLSVGRRLANVLELLGPAYIKSGQAAHSFRGTPEDIRSGLLVTKHDIAVRPRWEIFQLIDKLPEDFKKRLGDFKLGRRLGAASYYYVYEIELPDGSHRALALLKPDAKDQSEFGFSRLARLVESLKGSRALGQFPESLADIIEQARSMAVVETDSSLAMKQSAHAEELYKERRIEIGNEVFNVGLARTLEAGEGYRLMELAEGIHFNELPNSPQKKNLGKAYHTLELIHILSGRPFDEDPHGSQIRIDGTRATRFDFGAMSLKPPTEAELSALGAILYKVKNYVDSQKTDVDFSNELSKLFLTEVEAHQKSGNQKTGYLHRVYKAWLALSDFRVDWEAADYRDVLESAVANTKIPVHDSVKNGYAIQMSFREKMRWLAGSFSGSAQPKIKILR